MEGKIVYFDKPGPENTEEVLRIAKLRAAELGINNVVVASNTGDTAVRAAEVLQGVRVIAVSRSAGFQEPNVQEFTEENKRKVESKGGVVLTATIPLWGGISGAMRKKFNMYLIDDIVAYTLRTFGQGIKVAYEISLMAADAGLVRTDEDVICIGGTRKGADTAVVLRPVNTVYFFDLQIKEILCKPHF